MIKKIVNIIRDIFQPGIELSYSKINAYRLCPNKYKMIYDEGMYSPPSPNISLGLSIHRTLEDFHMHNSDSFDDLMESYNKSWVNKGFSTPQQAHDYFEKGQRILENYWQSDKENKTQIMYVEKEFRFSIGRNKLRGIIDRIDRHPDGRYELIDYKTHNDIWSNNKISTDIQLSLYALACKKVLGFTPHILSFYFLSHNKKLTTERSKIHLNQTKKLVKNIAKKIKNKSFTPNYGHCQKCEFFKSCQYTNKKIN